MITHKKVGGIRFLRMGRLQVSVCWCKPKPRDAKPSLIHGLRAWALREIHATDWALLVVGIAGIAMSACTAWAR